MFIRRTNQPLEVGMGIRLGGREGKIVYIGEPMFQVGFHCEDYISFLPNLHRFPELEIWVDDEPKPSYLNYGVGLNEAQEKIAENYRSKLKQEIYRELAEAVDRSVITMVKNHTGQFTVDPNGYHEFVDARKLIAELKKLSEV